MAILSHPHKTLRVNCREVTVFDDSVRSDAEKIASAISSNSGLPFFATGMAANQVGVFSRIIVFKKAFGGFLTMVNPVVQRSFLPLFSLDLCASIPGRVSLKLRKGIVSVRYNDLDGRELSSIFFGSAAFILQHEIEHLDGRLIID